MADGSYRSIRIAGVEHLAEVRDALATDMGSGDRDPGLPVDLDDDVAFIRRLQRQTPYTKLAVFARRYENSEVLTSLPLYARVELALKSVESIDNTLIDIASLTIPLGQVSTDHTGYASFDLATLRSPETLLSLIPSSAGNLDPDSLLLRVKLWVLPFGDDFLAVDAMQDGEIAPTYVSLRIELDAQRLEGRPLAPQMPAMQSPGIMDWRLSPGSFAASAGRLVGEGGCEDLYPANLATQQFGFHQLVRRLGTELDLPSGAVASARYGYLVEYRCEWFPIGHSLGQILYSLPLAPGEEVNLAISDWRRSDVASRSEDTTLSEQLDHDQARDRTIAEVVEAAVHEHQSGHSAMFGLAGSVLAPIGPAFVGGSLGLGAATTSSSGTRSISADTTQRLSDAFHQASTAIRQLRSTVVSQAAQAEQGRYETRRIVNHNHCHSLTILYYEVLRHHRIVTGMTRRRPVLFVQFDDASFDFTDEANVLAHRTALEPVLLDTRLLSGFDALARRVAGKIALEDAKARYAAGTGPGQRADWTFTRLLLSFTTGNDATDGNVFLTATLLDGTSIRLKQVEPADTDTASPYFFGNPDPHDDFERNTVDAYYVEPDTPFKWADLRAFLLGLVKAQTSGSNDDWRLEKLRVIGFTSDGETATLLDADVQQKIEMGSTLPELTAMRPKAAAGEAAPPQLSDFVSAQDSGRAANLLDHLKRFETYYSAAILADGDIARRIETLRDVDLRPGVSIADAIENHAVGTNGLEIAFPLTSIGDAVVRDRLNITREEESIDLIQSEDLVALPTRGVFAEAKLGHCSACEVIDNTRFWDWQKSPIPGEAPAIEPLSTGSKYQAPSDLQHTAFPNSIVNIANPPAAPDPTGLSAALQVLGTSDLFRDMSGMNQLGPFLGGLTQSTTGAVSALAGDKRQKDLIDQIKGLPDLTPNQKADLYQRVLGGGSPSPSSSSGASPSPDTAASATAAPNASTTPETPAAPAPASALAPAPKPAKPRPTVPGQLVLNVGVDLKGIASNPGEGELHVTPDNGDVIQVGPMSLYDGAMRAILKDPKARSGMLNVLLKFKRTIRGRVPGLVYQEIIDVRLHGSVPFTAPASATSLHFMATPTFDTVSFDATSNEEAEEKGQTEARTKGYVVVDIKAAVPGISGGMSTGLGTSTTTTTGNSTGSSSTVNQKFVVYMVKPEITITAVP